jgi:hypothetical protein
MSKHQKDRAQNMVAEQSAEQSAPKPISVWNEQDIKNVQGFSELLNKVGTYNLSTKEVIHLYGYLVWFNSLAKKIDDSLFEIKSVKQVGPKGD